MKTYIFYGLDRHHSIISDEAFEFATDREAVARAMEVAGEIAIEVWQGDRKIAFIAAMVWPIRGHIEQMRKGGELLDT